MACMLISPFFPEVERHARLLLFRNEVVMEFWLNPPWIGFFYFVNLDISASIWVFYTLTNNSTRHLQHDRSAEYAPVGRIRARPFFRSSGNGGHDRLRGSRALGCPQAFGEK